MDLIELNARSKGVWETRIGGLRMNCYKEWQDDIEKCDMNGDTCNFDGAFRLSQLRACWKQIVIEYDRVIFEKETWMKVGDTWKF